MGAIPKKSVSANLKVLLNVLNTNLTELKFKHALVRERGNETFLWLTLYPENTQLTPRTMQQIIKAKSALVEHAKTFWAFSVEVATSIELSKIDVAVDLNGSFMPNNREKMYGKIRQLLNQTMTEVFNTNSLNFLTLASVNDLRVVNGENNLETCY